MRGAGVVGGEGVEDAVAGVADLERVPGDGAFLGDGQVPAGLEECPQFVALTSLGLKQREYAQRNGHENGVLSVVSRSRAIQARLHVVGVVSGQVSYLWPAGLDQRVTRVVPARIER